MIDPHYEFVQRRKLKEAVNNTRLMGFVFAGLGGLPLYMMYDSRASLALQILAVVDTAVLIGPGVWYIFGAHMIRQLQMRGVRISLRIAWAQLAAVVLGIVVGLGVAGQNKEAMMLPALLATFFVPALIALMVQLAKARGVIRLLNPEVHAFEAIPLAAIAPVLSNAQGDSHGSAPER
jgi:hypothetical protein